MKRHLYLALLVSLFITAQLCAQSSYFPPRGNWELRQPEQLGLDAAKIQEAVQFAIDNENPTPRDLEEAHYKSFGREPFGYAVGPFKERGPQTGIIVYKGYIVAEWGEPQRVDMTFSVSKTFLSSTVGLAVDRGMIRSVDDQVHPYMAPVLAYEPDANRNKADRFGEPYMLELFETEHNRKITWDHLLRQTSDWEGTLWGKPDWADRPDSSDRENWLTRERHEPGTVYKYNDTRVNLLALAATNIWRRPLPKVLREYIMDPIGASPTWRWHGYENSWVVIDGELMQAVSGGGHWGGGMFISARDQARFGYFLLNRGNWNGAQILSENWIQMARTPTEANKGYGFMNWFLNTDQERLPSAPESAVVHLGNGTNMIYLDEENDLVVVARWIQGGAMDGFIQRILAAINE